MNNQGPNQMQWRMNPREAKQMQRRMNIKHTCTTVSSALSIVSGLKSAARQSSKPGTIVRKKSKFPLQSMGSSTWRSVWATSLEKKVRQNTQICVSTHCMKDKDTSTWMGTVEEKQRREKKLRASNRREMEKDREKET